MLGATGSAVSAPFQPGRLDGLLALTATTVTLALLAGCGGDSGSSDSTPRQDAGDDVHMSIRKIWSPNHDAYIECVVLTAPFYKSGTAAVSCDWP